MIDKIMKAYTFLVLLIILIAMLFGCTTTKKIDSTSIKKELNVDSLVSAKLDSTAKYYEEKIRETKALIEFFEGNESQLSEIINALQSETMDSTMAADSLRKLLAAIKCPESKIIYRSDGSVEITGARIKNLSATIFELQKKLDSVSVKKENVASVTKNIVEETKLKTVDKKTKFLSWLMFLIAGYVLGVFAPPMKILNKAKSLLTKK